MNGKPWESPLLRRLLKRILLSETVVLLVLIIGSLTILFPMLRERAISSAEQSVETFEGLLDSQLEEYVSISNLIATSTTVEDVVMEYQKSPSAQNYARVSLALTEGFANRAVMIRAVRLTAPDGAVFNSATNFRDPDDLILEDEGYQLLLDGKRTSYFSRVYEAGITTAGGSLVYASNLYIGGSRYVLTLFLNCAELTQIFDAAGTMFTGFFVLDESGRLFYTTNADTPEPDGCSLGSAKGNQGWYFTSAAKTSGWYLTGYMDTAALNATYRTLFAAIIVFCLAICLLTLAAAIVITARSIAPIHALSEDMQSISAGDRNVVSEVHTGDELERLSDVFNQMLRSLRESMEQRLAYETKEQRLRYNLLLSQIDTHFIGNTMSTINALARQGKTDKVVALNTAFLKILQNNLRIRDLDITDTIAQEVEMVNQYWIITQIREENQATLTIDVPDELLEELIPKNILQPLVENSLFHGLVNEDTGEIEGEIRLRMYDNGDSVCIIVSDNGCGISPERLAELNREPDEEVILKERGRHIGIANIRQRLKVFYKKDCMFITSENGTTVTLNIPKQLKEAPHAENL